MTPRHAVAIVTGGVLLALLGIGAWLLSNTPGSLVNEPPPELGPERMGERTVVFVTVEEGESAERIGEKLEDADVIDSARLFRTLAALMGVEDDLAAGEYEFFTGETALTAVQRISRGETRALRVTIREGLRREEVALEFQEENVVPADAFLQALGEPYEASFLGEIPEGAGLEGYLFPATYDFALNATPHDVVQRMLQAFDERYQNEIQRRMENTTLTLHEVVTLASIVEREAVIAEERPVIASVFLNRLEQGIKLDADPTVQYVLGSDPASVAEHGFWKQGLTVSDLQIDNPYNTYVHTGLPPGPIANPGLDSILAVLEPAETNYLYFVARPDGSHVFAETFEEHQQNICEIDPSRC